MRIRARQCPQRPWRIQARGDEEPHRRQHPRYESFNRGQVRRFVCATTRRGVTMDISVQVRMPRVTIKSGTIGADGQEVILYDYMCDWPDCPNVAEHMIGEIVELRATVLVCSEHAVMIRRPRPPGSNTPST